MLTMVCGLATAAKVPITVWMYSDSAAVKEWAKSYEATFNAANPDIELSFDMVDWASVSSKLLVAYATGTGPDIAYQGIGIADLEQMALPLNKYLDKYPDKTDFIPEIFNAGIYSNGRVLTMPMAMWGIFDLYNINVFETSGISLPKDWTSQLSAVRKITQVNSDNTVSRYGYGATQNGIMAIYCLHMAMEQLGKGMLYLNDTKVDLVNDRGIRAGNYVRDLWQAGMPDNSTTATNLANSVSGKTAIQGYATYNILEIDTKDSAGLEPRRAVGPETGKDFVRYNAGKMLILSTTKHPDEAWRVLSDFISPKTAEGYLGAQLSYLPVRKSMLARMSKIVPHPLALKMASIMYSPMLTYGAIHSYWGNVRTDGGNILLQALQGTMGVQTALEEAERTMNAILAEKMK